MKTLTEPEKAWLACAIDGEGTVYLVKRKSTFRSGVDARLSIFNTSKEFVDRVLNIVGNGHVYIHKSKRGRTLYEWCLQDYQSIAFLLEEILQYLIIKRREAELVIKFAKLRAPKKGVKLNPEELDILNEFLKLKKRPPIKRIGYKYEPKWLKCPRCGEEGILNKRHLISKGKHYYYKVIWHPDKKKRCFIERISENNYKEFWKVYGY